MDGGVIFFSVQEDLFCKYSPCFPLCISVILSFETAKKPHPLLHVTLIGYSPEARTLLDKPAPPFQRATTVCWYPSLSLCLRSTSLAPPSTSLSSISPGSDACPFCFYSERVSQHFVYFLTSEVQNSCKKRELQRRNLATTRFRKFTEISARKPYK